MKHVITPEAAADLLSLLTAHPLASVDLSEGNVASISARNALRDMSSNDVKQAKTALPDTHLTLCLEIQGMMRNGELTRIGPKCVTLPIINVVELLKFACATITQANTISGVYSPED